MLIDKARRESVKVKDLVTQGALFSGDQISVETEGVLRWFFQDPNFAKAAGRARIAKALREYADIAMADRADQADMLGKQDPDVTGAIQSGRVKQGYEQDGANTDAAQSAAFQGTASDRAGAQEPGEQRAESAGESIPQDSGNQAGPPDLSPNAPPRGSEDPPSPSPSKTRQNLDKLKAKRVEAVDKTPKNSPPVAENAAQPIANNEAKRQPEPDDVDVYIAKAKTAQNKLEGFGNALPGFQSPGVKSKARTVEKVEREGYASAADLKDIVRGGFVVNSQTEAKRVEAAITENFEIVEDKGWKRDRLTGYYDHKIIVKIDGINAELQIVPKPIWTAKNDGGAGELYNTSRVMQEGSVQRLAIEQQQRDIYAAALEGSEFKIAASALVSASGNSRLNQASEPSSLGGLVLPEGSKENSRDLSANPGAENQSPSRQTNAEPSLPERTIATGRPSIEPNRTDDNVSIPDDISSNGEKSNKAAGYGANNRIVSIDRAAELRKRLKEKLNPNRLNSGIDPEIMAIGTELAVFHIEAGARRFTDFSKTIASDLDMNVKDLRRYLRGWYNGARDVMEDSGESVVGMDGPR